MPWILDSDARVVGQVLLIVFLVLLLFAAGALVLTFGLMSTKGKVEPPGGRAHGRREPGEFRNVLKSREPRPEPETQPQDKKAS